MPTTRGAHRDFAALEARRFQAARLFGRGVAQVTVARELGVSRTTTHRWYYAWQAEGRRGLKAVGRAGRKPRLDRQQWAQVEAALLKGPAAHGFATALAFRWDGRRTRLYFQTHPGTYTDTTLIPFVRALKRHFRGQRVMLIWDGLGAHKSRRMARYLAAQQPWLQVERLPAYAPELNPVELLWGNLKGRELANLCPADLGAQIGRAHV